MGWTRWNGAQAQSLAQAAQFAAVEKTGYVVLTASQEEVPLDEGELERSGMVLLHSSRPEAAVVYGGGEGTGQRKLPYAIRWHEEDADFQHGRKKAYLRDPFNKLAKKTLDKAMKEEVRARFK